jgi:nitrite reductase/ring-hydroxylating ferredoxin subunit
VERFYACKVDDLTPGESMTLKATMPHVAVFHSDEDGFFATQDNCTHEDWSLGDDSDIDGCEVTCPLHMARYDLRTGEPLCPPATEALRIFPVEVEDDNVYVLI